MSRNASTINGLTDLPVADPRPKDDGDERDPGKLEALRPPMIDSLAVCGPSGEPKPSQAKPETA